jgi:predicted MFS family arabinose efflux permease
MLAYLLVHNLLALYIVQIILGFVKTISAPAFDTLYARNLDKNFTGQQYGFWEASFFLTAGIGAVVGGIVVNAFGFNGVFIIMSALAFVGAGYILTVPKNVL